MSLHTTVCPDCYHEHLVASAWTAFKCTCGSVLVRRRGHDWGHTMAFTSIGRELSPAAAEAALVGALQDHLG